MASRSMLLLCNAIVKAMNVCPVLSLDFRQRVQMKQRRKKARRLTKSEQMARVRNKDTEPEMALRRALWRSGLRYRLRPKLPGTPDLAFPRSKVAIFVDGCFWHGCPEHYTAPGSNVAFWAEKIARNRRRDDDVNRSLGRLGWKVLRFWEHEVQDELSMVLERIRTMV